MRPLQRSVPDRSPPRSPTRCHRLTCAIARATRLREHAPCSRVLAAISSARGSERPCLSSLSLMCLYCRARFVPFFMRRGGIVPPFGSSVAGRISRVRRVQTRRCVPNSAAGRGGAVFQEGVEGGCWRRRCAQRDRCATGWGEIVIAAALQGAMFGCSQTDAGPRRGFRVRDTDRCLARRSVPQAEHVARRGMALRLGPRMSFLDLTLDLRESYVASRNWRASWLRPYLDSRLVRFLGARGSRRESSDAPGRESQRG